MILVEEEGKQVGMALTPRRVARRPPTPEGSPFCHSLPSPPPLPALLGAPSGRPRFETRVIPCTPAMDIVEERLPLALEVVVMGPRLKATLPESTTSHTISKSWRMQYMPSATVLICFCWSLTIVEKSIGWSMPRFRIAPS
jgi:hypothetical protein